MLQAGDTFERYVIEDVLGQGAMGCVYRASDTRLNRRVALKVLAPDPDTAAMEAAEAAHRMRREALASAQIDHPNAVQVFDVGEFDGCPYIAMELIVGQTLKAYMGSDVPWAVKLRLLIDTARALGAAHRAGLIHRDVKPDNVMVREDGVVKVLDFGVVRAFGDETQGPKSAPAWTKLTVDGRILGTPAYMAPEQLNGQPLDGRVDQFSWGVLAYELLVGAIPWDAPKLTALMVAILCQEVNDLPGPNASAVPVGVKSVVLRALRKDPKERFPSMEDVIAALEPFIAAPQAPPPSSKARLMLGKGYTEPLPSMDPEWLKRRPPPPPGPPPPGTDAQGRTLHDEMAATRVLERPTKTRLTPLVVAICAAALVLLLGGALILLRSASKQERRNEAPAPSLRPAAVVELRRP